MQYGKQYLGSFMLNTYVKCLNISPMEKEWFMVPMECSPCEKKHYVPNGLYPHGF